MGYSSSEGKRLYFKVGDGCFHLYKGKGKEEEECDTVDGELDFLAIITEQAPGYAPAEKLVICLRDGEEQLIIKAGAKSVFSRMFAAYLGSIPEGQQIRIRTKEGTKGKVTSCFVDAWSSRDWQKVPYARIDGDPDQQYARAMEIVRAHEAFDPDYQPPQPGNPEPAQRQGIGPEFQRMLSTLTKHQYPAFAPNEAAYMSAFRRVLKDNDIRLASMTEAQFSYFADQFEKVGADKARWPREIRDLPTTEEYDPFADE